MATLTPASCCTTAVLSIVPLQSTMSNPCTFGTKFHVIGHGDVPWRKKIRFPLLGQTVLFATHWFGTAMMLKLVSFLPTLVTPGGVAVAEPVPSTASATAARIAANPATWPFFMQS